MFDRSTLPSGDMADMIHGSGTIMADPKYRRAAVRQLAREMGASLRRQGATGPLLWRAGYQWDEALGVSAYWHPDPAFLRWLGRETRRFAREYIGMGIGARGFVPRWYWGVYPYDRERAREDRPAE